MIIGVWCYSIRSKCAYVCALVFGYDVTSAFLSLLALLVSLFHFLSSPSFLSWSIVWFFLFKGFGFCIRRTLMAVVFFPPCPSHSFHHIKLAPYTLCVNPFSGLPSFLFAQLTICHLWAEWQIVMEYPNCVLYSTKCRIPLLITHFQHSKLVIFDSIACFSFIQVIFIVLVVTIISADIVQFNEWHNQTLQFYEWLRYTNFGIVSKTFGSASHNRFFFVLLVINHNSKEFEPIHTYAFSIKKTSKWKRRRIILGKLVKS